MTWLIYFQLFSFATNLGFLPFIATTLLFFQGSEHPPAPVHNTDAFIPKQIHIAIAGEDSRGMAISWVTRGETRSFVKYALSTESEHWSTVVGTFKTYKFGTYESGYLHHAIIPGPLKGGAQYSYQCGDPDVKLSKVFNFTAVPDSSSSTELRLGIIGDLGQTEFSMQTLESLVKQRNLNAILHAGDLSYADSDQHRWDKWGEMIESVSAELPWMVGPGNHEIELFGSLNPFLAYQSRFRMPAEESHGKDGNLYYSFNIGKAHIVFLTPYSRFDSYSAQYNWLVGDLKSVDRINTPWLIVIMHAPWYNSNTAHQGIEEPQRYMKRSMETLLYTYKVDLVVAGHVHAYERMFPVYKDERCEDGPTYIVIGDGGNREGLADKFLDPLPSWSAFHSAHYGYAHFTIHNETTATFGWYEDDESPDPIVRDAAVLYRDRELRQTNSFSCALGDDEESLVSKL